MVISEIQGSISHVSLSLYTCRIGSGFMSSNSWGKSNLEFGQIWSTVGLGSRLEQDCSSCREFEPEYHEAEDPPLSCVGTFYLWSSAITAFPVFTKIVLSHRQERKRNQTTPRCCSEAKNTWPWRFGAMMQEINGIDGDCAVEWADKSVLLAGIIEQIECSIYPVFPMDMQTSGLPNNLTCIGSDLRRVR
jgi:hypothetical protein